MKSVLLALCVGSALAEETPVPVYRYWKASVGDHFYTTSAAEIGTITLGATGNYGYVYEGIGFYIAPSKCASNTPLYRYWKSSVSDHFYTTSTAEIGTITLGATGNYGYKYEGITGYCNPATTAREGMVPLYRYWNSAISDHFYTISWSELGSGKYGWSYEGIQCYVYASATAAMEEENVANTDDFFEKEINGASFDPVSIAEKVAQVEDNMPLQSLDDEASKAVVVPQQLEIIAYTETPVPVYRYWKASVGDHFYTTSTAEIGTITLGATGNYGYVYEGIGFYIAPSKCVSNTPLYRYWKSSVSDHFYTTSTAEIGTITLGSSGNYGYVYEGITGYCNPATTAREGMVPLYRYWNSAISDHFYTISWSELGSGNYGWSYEGIQCYVYASATAAMEEENMAKTDDFFEKEMNGAFDAKKVAEKVAQEEDNMPLQSISDDASRAIAVPHQLQLVDYTETPVPVYRYWKASVGDHFYTTSTTEIGTITLGATGNYGYVYEGIGFYIAPSKCASNTPLYRYWKSSVSDHFYTTSSSEIGTITLGSSGNYGYVYEGITGYCNPATTVREGMVPLYRYWNSAISDHFYTISWSELGSGKYGWSYEGIQCYVYASATAAMEEENLANTDDLFEKEMNGGSFNEEKIMARIELFGAVDHMPFHSLQGESGKAMAANHWVLISSMLAVVLLMVMAAVYYKKQRKGEAYTPLV